MVEFGEQIIAQRFIEEFFIVSKRNGLYLNVDISKVISNAKSRDAEKKVCT